MASNNPGAPILDWIDFGKVSAERDDLLSQYFFDNGVLKSIIKSPSSFLLLGRKGAGKTALFKYLSENKEQFVAGTDILVPLAFEDYNWNVHTLLADEGKAESMTFKQSWKFIILVECVGVLQAWLKARGKSVPKQLSSVSSIIDRLFSSPAPSMAQLIGNKILSLSTLRLPKGGLDLESGDLDSINLDGGEVSFEAVKQKTDLRSALSQNIERLIALLELSLENYDQSWPKIYICFDRVDEAWDEASFAASQRVIAGLVGACDTVNAQYKGNIRPILFLREDIFDVLSINDSNKLREDCGSLLHWDKESLFKLILKRVNYFGNMHSIQPILDIDSIFDKTEMRQRAKPSNYLLKRTMMRPRDLISLLGRTVKAMKDKANDPFNDQRDRPHLLECAAVYDAEPGYSEWLRQEILDEWKVQYPVVRDLLGAIQKNGSTIISKSDLEANLRAINTSYPDHQIVDHLKFMFENSILGIKIGSSTEWRFKCFYPNQGFIEAEDYKVHEGLIRSLNLTEPRSRE